ncbi:MAG TPA: SGNH/GDSL hydrolase family protein [Longimicrobiales bacterium]|nr:SGNH/GDSL hydrolase family protein [Longimicrobiales bacterium]
MSKSPSSVEDAVETMDRRSVVRRLLGLPLAAGAVAGLTAPGRASGASTTATTRRALMLEPGSKLVMIGDSITDAGRARPIGEGRGDTLGNGYVMMVDALLSAVHPEARIRVVNMGISGNTVRNLAARWQTDVFNLEPDYVSIMIGANDVWRQFDSPLRTEQHVFIEEYESVYEELITQTLPRVKGLILFTPFYLEPNRQDAMRATMDRYSDVVRRLAQRHSLPLVDSQAVFDELLEHVYPAAINWDRVHPNHVGSMVLARAFVKTIGLEW